MEVNPQISVPVGAGSQGGVPIYNLSGRKLESGSIRLRDRQTLIITGVIQSLIGGRCINGPSLEICRWLVSFSR